MDAHLSHCFWSALNLFSCSVSVALFPVFPRRKASQSSCRRAFGWFLLGQEGREGAGEGHHVSVVGRRAELEGAHMSQCTTSCTPSTRRPRKGRPSSAGSTPGRPSSTGSTDDDAEGNAAGSTSIGSSGRSRLREEALLSSCRRSFCWLLLG
jgi:hypothetical protein